MSQHSFTRPTTRPNSRTRVAQSNSGQAKAGRGGANSGRRFLAAGDFFDVAAYPNKLRASAMRRPGVKMEQEEVRSRLATGHGGAAAARWA